MFNVFTVALALVIPLVLTACGGGGGPAAPANPTGPTAPPVPGGRFPAELAGIWQNTLASSGDFVNPITGTPFSMTEGYSAQFKVKPSGEFYFAHYSAGVAPNCSFVSFFDQMTGVAQWANDRLTLRPRERRLDVKNCANSGSFAQPLDPLVFQARVTESPTALDPTLQMELIGGPYPLNFKLLDRTPPPAPTQAAQPEGFQLGADPPYQEILGLWGRYETDFYDPQTGAYRFPDCCGEHRFLRFAPDGYELGLAFGDAQVEGVCKKDLIYFERGQALFRVTDQRGPDTFQGDVRLAATEARMVVRVRNCGADDGVRIHAMTPLTAYYRFSHTLPAGGESFMLGCPYRNSDWTFAVCYDANPWYTYQRRSGGGAP